MKQIPLGNAKDLIGQKFGLLTPMYRVENSPSGAVRWLFKCDCGNEVIRTVANLKQGVLSSCGCMKNKNRIKKEPISITNSDTGFEEIPIGQAEDLSKIKFGNWTVLHRTTNIGTSTRWVCQCDCGTTGVVLAQNLKNGTSTSCGCQNRIKASERMLAYNLANINHQDIIGKRFGKLVAIEYLGMKRQQSRDKNESWYKCKCDCGNVKEVSRNSLLNLNTLSCGCIASSGELKIKELLEQNNIIFKQEYIFSDLKNPNTNAHLRFDFAIFDNNNDLLYLIEFDGRQHFQGPDTDLWTSYNCSKEQALKDIQFRDSLKNSYCKQHNIILKRIPYTDFATFTYKDIISNKYNI